MIGKLQTILANKRVRQVVSIGVIVITLGVFTYYLAQHPDTLRTLVSLSPFSLIMLTAFYLLTIIANAMVLSASLRLIGKPLPYKENVLLTSYSSIINFFGPLQSGPGFRALYLKQRHNVSVRSFFYYTIVFYAVFAAVNVVILLYAGFVSYGSTAAAFAILAVVATMVVLLWYVLKVSKRLQSFVSVVHINTKQFWLIVLGALLLSVSTAGAYYTELIHVDNAISPIQALVYAAAANLALFVSLTPGAIGFRESFLFLSQQLHQIPTNTIITASIIDRAFYVVFLLVLFLAVTVIGARIKLFKRKL